jgi:hypothetical protein
MLIANGFFRETKPVGMTLRLFKPDWTQAANGDNDGRDIRSLHHLAKRE